MEGISVISRFPTDDEIIEEIEGLELKQVIFTKLERKGSDGDKNIKRNIA